MITFLCREKTLKKVLLIKIGALGDLSYALPAAKALKKELNCHITWLVGKSCHAFLTGHDYIDQLIITDDKKFYSKNKLIRAVELLKLYWQLRQRFDCVIIAHRDHIYYHAFKLFSRESIFQLARANPNHMPHRVLVKPLTLHESLAIKKLVFTAIKHYIPHKTDIDWQWDYSYIAPVHLILPDPYCVLHLGGGFNTKTEFRLKCWPHWNQLILKLLQQTQLNLVFVGASSEESEYQKIEEQLKQAIPEKLSYCFNLIGKTKIPQLVDVIRQSDFFMGVDSGPLHIADSLNKTSIGLFGPTSTISWGLLSEKSKALQQVTQCSPCYQDDGIFPECNFQHHCMKLLNSQQVFEEIKKIIPEFIL